jgi:4-hydroxythreonine-4-phosphate dehydrogenase
VPVATCASGTAFDIVGRNVANPGGLQQAFELAVAIAQSNAHRAPPATARVGVTA